MKRYLLDSAHRYRRTDTFWECGSSMEGITDRQSWVRRWNQGEGGKNCIRSLESHDIWPHREPTNICGILDILSYGIIVLPMNLLFGMMHSIHHHETKVEGLTIYHHDIDVYLK
jgi:hypothetical protein